MLRMQVDWSIKAHTDVDLSLSRFRRYLEHQGFRESTIQGYVSNISRYLKCINDNNPTIQDATQFMDHLHDWKISRSTLNQYAYALKAFHKMLGDELPIVRIEPNNHIPYYFSAEEVSKIFTVCNNLKHLAMLKTLFYGCLRASELCNLDIEDIDLKSLTIRIREGKGGKDGIVFISDDCAKTLKQYLEIRQIFRIEGLNSFFGTDYGHKWTRTEVHRMFIKYKRKAGIEKRGGIHVFARHSSATIMVANGCDIRIVKEVLRHKDIRTTLRYAHVSDKTKREKYEQYLTL
jgi:integrase/recombinase XerD